MQFETNLVPTPENSELWDQLLNKLSKYPPILPQTNGSVQPHYLSTLETPRNDEKFQTQTNLKEKTGSKSTKTPHERSMNVSRVEDVSKASTLETLLSEQRRLLNALSSGDMEDIRQALGGSLETHETRYLQLLCTEKKWVCMVMAGTYIFMIWWSRLLAASQWSE